jgi:hypothetical protein
MDGRAESGQPEPVQPEPAMVMGVKSCKEILNGAGDGMAAAAGLVHHVDEP